MGQYGKAIELHQESKKIVEEVGDRASVGRTCGNLGNCYESMGQYGKAIKLHQEHKKIAEEVGDRAGVGTASCNLGNCYMSMGQYVKAIGLHQEHKKIAEELGDRAGVGRACGNLCRSYAQDGKFDQALTYGNQRHKISRELQLRDEELQAAHDMGTVLRLALSADRRGHATEASPGQASDAGVCGAPHTPSSLSEGMICRAEEAERWLRIALEGGLLCTHLQLARLDFDTGREEEALAHLKLYLAWCVEGARGKCEGCGQVRGEDAQMLTCGGELSLLRHCCLHLCCACAQMLTCSCLTHSKAAA